MEYSEKVTVAWDYDVLEQSLRRGFITDYNFYMIYLDRGRDYWRKIDPKGTTELYYIGSTRTQTTTSRLLNNHEGLSDALQEGFGDIRLALGYLINPLENSIRAQNDLVKTVESALIYHLTPTRNRVNRMRYDGPEIQISNRLRSYGGLDIHSLVFDRITNPVDHLLFSSLSRGYIDRYFKLGPDLFEEGVINVLGILERDLPQLNDEFTVS